MTLPTGVYEAEFMDMSRFTLYKPATHLRFRLCSDPDTILHHFISDEGKINVLAGRYVTTFQNLRCGGENPKVYLKVYQKFVRGYQKTELLYPVGAKPEAALSGEDLEALMQVLMDIRDGYTMQAESGLVKFIEMMNERLEYCSIPSARVKKA